MITLTIFLTGEKKPQRLGEDKNKEIQSLSLQMTEASAQSSFLSILHQKKKLFEQKLELNFHLLLGF